jgi:hypothetical protein
MNTETLTSGLKTKVSGLNPQRKEGKIAKASNPKPQDFRLISFYGVLWELWLLRSRSKF